MQLLKAFAYNNDKMTKSPKLFYKKDEKDHESYEKAAAYEFEI